MMVAARINDATRKRFVSKFDVRGEQHHNSRLTEADVLAIREAYAAGGLSRRKLAAAYGIDRKQIGRIVDRKSWAHI